MRSDDLTRLLDSWSAGDSEAAENLTRQVYPELIRMAQAQLRRETFDSTVTAAELVHEAFLRLLQGSRPAWGDRAHFFGVVARIMRQVLVDRARKRNASKRDGTVARVRDVPANPRALDLLAVDQGLLDLAEFDERKARIVELRVFAGLTPDEIATDLNVSVVTVRRELRTATAWLKKRSSLDS